MVVVPVISKVVNSLIDPIKNVLTSIIVLKTTIHEFVKSTFESTKEVALEIPSTVFDAMDDLIHFIPSMLKTILNGIIDAINTLLYETVGGVNIGISGLNEVTSAVGKSLDIPFELLSELQDTTLGAITLSLSGVDFEDNRNPSPKKKVESELNESGKKMSNAWSAAGAYNRKKQAESKLKESGERMGNKFSAMGAYHKNLYGNS